MKKEQSKYSLFSVISEIRIRKPINHKETFQLFRELWRGGNLENIEKYNEILELFLKYNFSASSDNLVSFIKKLDNKTLSSFYKDLLQIKQKYNISEIKILGKITPEQVFNKFIEIAEKDYTTENVTKLIDLKDKYGWYKTDYIDPIQWIKNLPKSELNSLYQDLLKIQ
ncbi:MAG TPA: hypothetical protein VFV86_09460 [Nitrososphaeraceae archaeon]|nr:hypothetical protein [Nitrososphaeraceae archaeon]